MAFEKQGSFKVDAPPLQPIKKRPAVQLHIQYDLKGWLEKKSKSGQWQRRYFALPGEHPSLLYFRTDTSMERADASIDLKLVSLVKSEGRMITLKLMQNKVMIRPLPTLACAVCLRNH